MLVPTDIPIPGNQAGDRREGSTPPEPSRRAKEPDYARLGLGSREEAEARN